MITITSLSKRHGSRQVLQEVSLSARPGRVTGFVGPNGAGKSSTLRCLLGLDRIDSGTALIGGRPYRELRHPRARSGPCSTAPTPTPHPPVARTCGGWPPGQGSRDVGSKRSSRSWA